MNHLGLASRSAPPAKFVFAADVRASLRRALQFGRTGLVSVAAPRGKAGARAGPCDVDGRGRGDALALDRARAQAARGQGSWRAQRRALVAPTVVPRRTLILVAAAAAVLVASPLAPFARQPLQAATTITCSPITNGR